MTNLPISEDPVSNSCQGLSNMSIGSQQILSFSPFPLVLGLTVLERWWHAFRMKTVRRHWIVLRNVNLHNLETNRSSSHVVLVVTIKRWFSRWISDFRIGQLLTLFPWSAFLASPSKNMQKVFMRRVYNMSGTNWILFFHDFEQLLFCDFFSDMELRSMCVNILHS